jgi:aldehyde dehydrogenase (NAD+)
LNDAHANLSVLPSGGLFIDGQFADAADGATLAHVNPSTGGTTRAFAVAGRADIDRAVQAARHAFPAWKALGAAQRRALLLRVADLFEAGAAQLAPMAVIENGTPVNFAGYVAAIAPADWFRYYAGWIDKLSGQVPPMLDGAGLHYTVREPYGVIAILTAFNAPMSFIGMKVAAALAAGNCVVIKPSELAPWSALAFAQLCSEAGLPPGVVNVVPAAAAGGEALVMHAGVDKISFTGGGRTASAILAAAATQLKPVTLELGGKSANLIYDDANLPTAIGNAVYASVALQSGQACIAGTRLLVQRGVYDAVVQQVAAVAASLPVGDPFSPQTAMGPIISAAHCERIARYVDGLDDGRQGRIVLRGERRDLGGGFFLSPTVVADVDADSALAQEEIFGPVLAIIPFDNDDDAIRIANRSRYGLAGYVFTRSLERALRAAQQIEAGTIAVNKLNLLPANLPFGGFKASGFGREGGEDGILDMTHSKSVQIAL